MSDQAPASQPFNVDAQDIPGTRALDFRIGVTSVARYVFDLADWDRSRWIVPLGASGHPGDPHYADQAERWAAVATVPMTYGWDRVAASGAAYVLAPAPA